MNLDYIQKLISPIQISDFSESYWEKKCLILRRDDNEFFDNILNQQDINDFFGKKDIYYPFIRVVLNGEPLSKSEYVKEINEPGFTIIDTDKIFTLYNSGATIVIQKGQLSIKKLTKFCDIIEQECNFSVNANIYVTPKNTAGFNAHYDTHDIFILQIAGKKHWRIYDSLLNLPLNNQLISKEDSQKYSNVVPETEIELFPGDLIYIPRGFVHDTFTTNSNSIHITLGVFPFKIIDLLKKIFAKAESEEKFRKFLPTNLSSSDEKNYFIQNFKTIAKLLIDETSIEGLLSSFEDNFLAERFANTENRFFSIGSLQEVNIETKVAVMNNISFKLSSSLNNEPISLKYYDKEIKFPYFVEDALKSIINSSNIVVKAIKGSLDDSSKVILVKKLIEQGFLRIALE